LIVVEIHMLLLVVGIELKVLRHSRWILRVLSHGEGCGVKQSSLKEFGGVAVRGLFLQ
jgi:hypothetical protein